MSTIRRPRTVSLPLACNQVCGLSHTNMYAKVRVVTQEEYTAWVYEQAAQGVQPDGQAMKVDLQTASN